MKSMNGRVLPLSIEKVAPAAPAFLGENPRLEKMFPHIGVLRVLGHVSREGRWGWDGACLEWPSDSSDDPIASTTNLYCYCGDEPTNWTDPSGLAAAAAVHGTFNITILANGTEATASNPRPTPDPLNNSATITWVPPTSGCSCKKVRIKQFVQTTEDYYGEFWGNPSDWFVGPSWHNDTPGLISLGLLTDYVQGGPLADAQPGWFFPTVGTSPGQAQIEDHPGQTPFGSQQTTRIQRFLDVAECMDPGCEGDVLGCVEWTITLTRDPKTGAIHRAVSAGTAGNFTNVIGNGDIHLTGVTPEPVPTWAMPDLWE